MKKSLLLLLLFLSCWMLKAETKRFYVTRLGTTEGLASNQVLTVFKDKHNYLWVGSSNGLQRFDGRKFMTYQMDTPQGRLPAQSISEILVDLDGKMWLRVGDQYGTYIPEKQEFSPVPFEKNENRFQGESLWMDRQGNLFVILFNNKLLWIDQKNGKITDQNLPIKIPDGWRPRSIFEDKKGRYWVSNIEGISVYDPQNGAIYTHDSNPLGLEVLKKPDLSYVFNVYEDSEGIFWINYWAPDERLLSYDALTKFWRNHKSEIAPPNDNYQEAYGSLELPHAEIWRYGIQTLASFDRRSKKFSPLIQSDIQFDKISKLLWDEAGGIWMATDAGLYFLHFDTPSIYFLERTIENGNFEYQAIEEVIHRGDTSVWLGSWGKGIGIIKPLVGELDTKWMYQGAPKGIESYQVWDLHHDKKRNVVWVALQKGLLQVIELDSRKVHFIYPEAFEGSTIRTIAEDQNGNLWFGTQSGSIIKYEGKGIDKSGFRRYRKFQGRIPKLMISRDQHLWVTTTNEGVYELDLQEGKILRHLDNTLLNSNNNERLLQVNDSIFLIGFELLNKYNLRTGQNEVFSYSNGLLSNTIFGMEIDADGLVWIYTPNGMTRFDVQTNTFYSFGKNHFFSNIPNDGRSGTRFSNGELAFVSNNGILIFDPRQFARNLPPPIPTITSIELFGEYIGDGTLSEIRRKFTSQENSLTFDFNILNFSIQDRFTYQYRLVGVETDWIMANTNFQAVYSLLPPGEYQFEVRSVNESGVVSQPAIYAFEINPSLVQTWWFKVFLGIVFLGIVYLIYRLHVNRILEVVKIRSRLARDLHDDMGSTLSTINILSSMAKTKIGTDPAKSSEYISKISENSQRMMEAMDDIVWSIKPQNDTMEKLIARMREFANQVLESKDIFFNMEIDEKVLGMKLSMDARRDLFLIFKEGINNAAKYSKAKRVFISFTLEKNLFTMKIKDYGVGFDLKDLDEGNGLENMNKRAANLSGTLTINSKPTEGTELILRINL
ncbi:two-component regulator propeller domain-containing protein [Algoriphagus sp. AK58]|uniref:ligand-binding sensor domain-containing protein n=1 Tax=Algoriphagus sp. AK58 TaxID=1406877 RepID=UPI00164EE336|nr:sensor histidine kinase [Algoriphagus sp. AK58]MBC6367861.1 hypothetical protein [Algoriphagus sp. AK58]